MSSPSQAWLSSTPPPAVPDSYVPMPVNMAAVQRRGTGIEAFLVPKQAILPREYHKQLDDLQLEAAQRACEGRESVFVTGAAGTGKSYAIEAIVSTFRKAGIPIAVTSPNAYPAFLLDGMTTQAFGCLGAGEASAKVIANNIRRGEYGKTCLERWMTTKVLVIEQCHVLSGEMTHLLDNVAQLVLKSTARFGGLQLIWSGDYGQVPPARNLSAGPYKIGRSHPRRYNFDDELAFDKLFDCQIELIEHHRHTDCQLISLLSKIRLGSPHGFSSEEKLMWSQLYSYLPRPEEQANAIHLFANKSQADMFNLEALKKLPGELHQFTSYVSANVDWISDSDFRMTELFEVPVDEVLELKVGSKVMAMAKINGLAPGLCGTVVAFLTKSEYNEIVLAEDSFLELRRNCTPDINAERERMYIFTVRMNISLDNPELDIPYPVVEYPSPREHNCSDVFLMLPHQFEADVKIEAENSTQKIERLRKQRKGEEDAPVLVVVQIPLHPASAMTVHRSAGHVFRNIVVVMEGMKDMPGLLYSAISRAESPWEIRLQGAKSMTPKLFEGNMVPVAIFYKYLGGQGARSAADTQALARAYNTRPHPVPPLNLVQVERGSTVEQVLQAVEGISDLEDWSYFPSSELGSDGDGTAIASGSGVADTSTASTSQEPGSKRSASAAELLSTQSSQGKRAHLSGSWRAT